jgi:hypothetical protein
MSRVPKLPAALNHGLFVFLLVEIAAIINLSILPPDPHGIPLSDIRRIEIVAIPTALLVIPYSFGFAALAAAITLILERVSGKGRWAIVPWPYWLAVVLGLTVGILLGLNDIAHGKWLEPCC